MQKQLFTIITVCYNCASQIERTLLSVIGQTYRNFEYIVIDGGSIDGTTDIIRKYQDYIDIFVSEPDKGVYDAMNKAVKLAHGVWLNFMNSGDVYSNSNILEGLVNSMILDKSAFVYSDFYVKRKGSLHRIEEDFRKGNLLHQSIFYKKELHEQYGLYLVTHPYIVSDYFFFIQVPERLTGKFDTPISINDTNGISMQGNWCGFQKYCVDFMFRKIGIWQLILKLNIRLIKNIVRKVILS